MRTAEKLIRRPSLCAAIMMSCVQPVTGSQASIPVPLQVGGVPGVQTPDWQVSSPLQTLLSTHGVPFATGVRWQPAFGSQVSVVHGLLSAQLTGVPGWQTPAWQTSTSLQSSTGPAVQTPVWHVSPPLHRFPSLHGVPSDAPPCWQPVMGSQVSMVHGFPSLQLGAMPCVQLPFWHVSLPLHTLASLHEVPFGTTVCLQPATGSHVSVVHGLASAQVSAVPAVHTPAWHVSVPLHALPSLHEVPFETAVCLQPATGSQVSVVQGLLSLQVSAVPAVQAPAWHVSTPLHTLPSLHEVPSGTAVCLQPVAGSHVSVVHAFASSHFSAVPAVHTPAWHVSTPLHTFPSLHEVPLATAACWQPCTGSHVSVVQGLLSLQLGSVPAVQMPV